MAFNPRTEYQILPKNYELLKFHRYRDRFVTRPPYQRKNVWSTKKKQALIDSIFRRYYVPKLVVREVRLSDGHTVEEVIDGQQRITCLQEFYAGKFRLPKSLEDLSPDLPGKHYDDLAVGIREYFDELEISADRILNIDDPKSPEHQKVATEIFWRLQQGESLNQMEVVHARLSSLTRNFLVRYADDLTFDYEAYRPIDANPNKHAFFRIIDRKNDRMEHLSMLARMLLIETAKGAAEVKDAAIVSLVEGRQSDTGIGDYSYENEDIPRQVIATLDLFHSLFLGDPMLADEGKIKELSKEYFVLSFFMLLRHIRKFYVIDSAVKKSLRSFLVDFHSRWKSADVDDRDMAIFSDSRQQGAADLVTRDQIVRQMFFEYLDRSSICLKAKDKRRAFNEGERIAIYRNGKGMCAQCIADGKPESEAAVSWAEFEADHLFPHSRGGETSMENSQLLCRHHNRAKGARAN